ncbi:zinc-finger domain-containing protein [Siculibacillus lacustris]|uniref:Zinc-finger domain-containing protein n=1 Tax=Siculibacillus lacustris TaxID=1549641 RepID=A0A4Q9VI02_9HYPH|nr:zinc-finger domain-containing protein [Siculibacillus lacustris]TBW33887.1 zinc-finger domain-containing protein [Siculibacillus lacustris]
MADAAVPHFANDHGLDKIVIGAREFMCVGALPPFDHPHVFLDMGGDSEKLCPYCGTRYVLDPSLGAKASIPADAFYQPVTLRAAV